MATKATDRNSKNFLMEESLRIAVQKQIQAFIADDDMQTHAFPVSFTNTQRGFVHKYAQSMGLKSKSHGKGINRFLTVYKPNTNTQISYDAVLTMSSESSNLIKRFLIEHKVTDRERSDAKELATNKKPNQYYYGFAIFKLLVPPHISVSRDIIDTHAKLPITEYRPTIIEMINTNRVVVIAGDTGSGKTTQVPQYILEDHTARSEPCRIICTQPRRIAAVSMADRVAYERGEIVGSTVGYQIRLESKVSPTSNLIYTTSGFLLRCLISDSSATWLSRITHIVMDEVHERDKYTDFLFIAIKEAMADNPKLKVILMSATIDTDIYTAYFACPLLKIPGRMYPVEINQLEDVLGMLRYADKQIQSEALKPIASTVVKGNKKKSSKRLDVQAVVDDQSEIINETLQECFYGRCDFSQFFYLVTGEGVDVNVKHSDTELNALMIAAINDLPDVIEVLLKMGADPSVIGGFGYTATEWALNYGHAKCVELLQRAEELDPVNIENEQRKKDNQKRLQSYLEQTNETEIDQDLLFKTIKFIHEQMPDGSILVFLPGYDTIVEQMNTISEGDIAANIEVLFLHGNMETSDQKRVFAPPAPGSRKVILSTNIAETSLTIDDVVYVIDCGKVKQISYDSLSESTSLTSTWISKACAKQRMGRAGRTKPGFCYRLYSKQRFDAMEEFTLPELLRIPLTELCLHARIMTKTTITDYLSMALQPPSTSTINQSIKLLKTIGALNEKENVTELGYRLVDLPVDVQLGKMLLYSILLKCLDPVLTIVSALSVKDPFVLNFEGDTPASLSRKTLADGSCSDLMVFIKLYQLWVEHKTKGQDYRFCRENQVSSGIMELINGFRTQILGQLRTIGFILPRGAGDMADVNQNSNNFATVKACFVAGFYPNVCRVDRKVGNLKSKQEKKLLPHVTSVLREKNLKSLKTILTHLPSEWLVYEEKSRVERLCLVRNNTVVTPLTIALFGGPMYIPKNNVICLDEESDSENDDLPTVKLVLDDWIAFLTDEEVAVMVHELRIKLNSMFMKTLCCVERKPGLSANDSRIVNVIAQVLETEDSIAGFRSPKDVGLRPILLPLKGNPRNKNGVERHRGGPPNGKFFNQGHQHHNHQQSSFQFQSNNQLNYPSRSQPATLYNRNGNGSVANNTPYVSHFKGQVMLNAKVRYFILHAESKKAIVNSWGSSKRWPYLVSSLRLFKSIKNSEPSPDIILFFIVPNGAFFGVGRLNRTGNLLSIECLSKDEVSFAKTRNLKGFASNDPRGTKNLDEYKNGEEIFDTTLAEKLFHLFIGTSASS
ncbi:3'-5' RNA helicase YTHDC2-like [Bradysia coprophila]|uniref:3'-5' RNA helicase YTHDC2-like n=1 Tax=Bradysia coprophila TaxID=38358 RepID=UPI00187D98BA|nr:3'-5' RNA helicase YTHDC2-like [Bradysia coprophila]